MHMCHLMSAVSVTLLPRPRRLTSADVQPAHHGHHAKKCCWESACPSSSIVNEIVNECWREEDTQISAADRCVHIYAPLLWIFHWFLLVIIIMVIIIIIIIIKHNKTLNGWLWNYVKNEIANAKWNYKSPPCTHISETPSLNYYVF